MPTGLNRTRAPSGDDYGRQEALRVRADGKIAAKRVHSGGTVGGSGNNYFLRIELYTDIRTAFMYFPGRLQDFVSSANKIAIVVAANCLGPLSGLRVSRRGHRSIAARYFRRGGAHCVDSERHLS